MSDDRFRRICEQLKRGDYTGAEEVFRSYEPYLRMVVRRQLTPRLRAKFDSIDVVQSVWANVLHGLRNACWEFTDEAHFRAFLIRLALNRFVSLYRHYRVAMEREQPIAMLSGAELPESREDRPSEVAQANELWEQIVASAAPAHRELLILKSRGLPLAEIANRTGLHQSSIRRILYKLEDQWNTPGRGECEALEAGCA